MEFDTTKLKIYINFIIIPIVIQLQVNTNSRGKWKKQRKVFTSRSGSGQSQSQQTAQQTTHNKKQQQTHYSPNNPLKTRKHIESEIEILKQQIEVLKTTFQQKLQPSRSDSSTSMTCRAIN